MNSQAALVALAILTLSSFSTSSVSAQARSARRHARPPEAPPSTAPAEVAPSTPPAEDPSRDLEARALFSAGTVAYNEGRYASALEYFERAYALSPRSGMLFNIASTHDRLRNDQAARDAFQRYLDEAPDAANRADVEARIAILDAEIAARQAADTPAPAVPPPSASRDDSAGWVLVVSGAVLLAGGAVSLGMGIADESAVESADGVPFSAIRDAFERAPILQGVGYAALGVGVALASVGVVLLVLPSESTAASAHLELGFGRIGLRGTF